MRALAWLRKLRRNSKGNVLIMTAVSMPMIIGGAGMAIDSIQLTVWKRQLQRAADSAAIAGAYGEARGDDANTAVHRDLDRNFFPTLSEPEVVETGARLGFDRTVYVQLTAERSLPFMSFFTGGTPTTIRTEATAALVDEGEFCMLATYDGDEEAGINANGNATVDLACGIAANSQAENSITAGGTSAIEADPVTSVGGLNGETENFTPGAELRPYSAPSEDPFADRPLPTPPSPCDTALDVGNGETVVLTPGACYTAWNVGNGGIVQLPDGVYYVNGGNVDLHGEIESTGANGVTIIMTGTETNSDGDLVVGDFRQNGGGVLDIDASESGDYRGIALYRDPRANLITVTINGGAETDIRGAIYMPGTDLWYGGNAATTAACLQVVARIITFRGGMNIGNSCPEGGASQPFNQQVVRLVG